VNPRSRLQVLMALSRRTRASWGELLDSQDASIPEFHATLEALQAAGEVEVERGFARLTAAGRQAIGEGWRPLQLRCTACDGKGQAVAADHPLLQELERLLSGRPGPDLAYDQGAITSQDALLRAAFLEERGDLLGRDILMVGDFDLICLALALTRQPRRVLVLDIDTRVVDFVNAAAAREGLALEARPFDVRHPLADDLVGRFDVFLCDPVETLPGIRLYLSRGARALRGTGSAAYLGLTTIEASRRKWFDIQGLLHEMGFALTDARRRFSGYPDHDSAPRETAYSWPILEHLGEEGVEHRWYTSAFLRAEAVRPPEPAVTGEVELGPELYVDDEAWATPR
jgi:predicted methyltransferase